MASVLAAVTLFVGETPAINVGSPLPVGTARQSFADSNFRRIVGARPICEENFIESLTAVPIVWSLRWCVPPICSYGWYPLEPNSGQRVSSLFSTLM